MYLCHCAALSTLLSALCLSHKGGARSKVTQLFATQLVGGVPAYSYTQTMPLWLATAWAFKTLPFWKALLHKYECYMWSILLVMRIKTRLYSNNSTSWWNKCHNRQGSYVEKLYKFVPWVLDNANCTAQYQNGIV